MPGVCLMVSASPVPCSLPGTRRSSETFAELKWKVSLLPTLSQPSVWDDKLCFQCRSGWIALFLMRNAENSKLLVLKNKPFSFRDLAQKWTVLTVQAPRLSLLLWSQRWWGFWLQKETRSPWPGPRAQSRSVCLAAPGPSWLPLQVGAGPAPRGAADPREPQMLNLVPDWLMRNAGATLAPQLSQSERHMESSFWTFCKGWSVKNVDFN